MGCFGYFVYDGKCRFKAIKDIGLIIRANTVVVCGKYIGTYLPYLQVNMW